MIGMGTIVNIVAIIAGASIGLLFKGILKQRFQDTIMSALGLAVMFIGLSGGLQGLFQIVDGTIETRNMMLMIVSLALGAFIGELLKIEDRLDQVGTGLRNVLKVKGDSGSSFVEGFVNSTLLFCIGAMAIVGSLNDGLSGDSTMLFAKSFIDGICAIFFASTLGLGVFFSVIPLGLYQGIITISAKFIEPYLSESLIGNISCIGSVLIFGIGINMIFGKKIKCGNLLPAVLVPVFYEIFINILP